MADYYLSQAIIQSLVLPADLRVRAELIGHVEPCMTEIYLHIDARMAVIFTRTRTYLSTCHCVEFPTDLAPFFEPHAVTLPSMALIDKASAAVRAAPQTKLSPWYLQRLTKLRLSPWFVLLLRWDEACAAAKVSECVCIVQL